MSYFLSRIPSEIHPNIKCIVMLHGVWSNEADLFSLASHFSDEYMIFSLRGSFILGQWKYAWFPVDFSTGRPLYNVEDVEKWYSEISSFLQNITQEYHLSSSQIFLLGFSQWAILSYYSLWKSPEQIGWIIWLSWRLLKEIDTTNINTDLYKGKGVFIWHGLQDAVLSYDESKLTTGFIEKVGLIPTFKTYNIGHTISQEEIDDIRIWLSNF